MENQKLEPKAGILYYSDFCDKTFYLGVTDFEGNPQMISTRFLNLIKSGGSNIQFLKFTSAEPQILGGLNPLKYNDITEVGNIIPGEVDPKSIEGMVSDGATVRNAEIYGQKTYVVFTPNIIERYKLL